jgi:phosphohistidine phosphatase
MKRITLIRHAKSDWNHLALKDFDRPLNKRGLVSAEFMSKIILKEDLVPDFILCSPAKRTKSTCQLLKQGIGIEIATRFESEIYEPNYMTLIRILSKIDNQVNHAWLIGHNPGISNLANYLTGDHSVSYMVTCHIITIDMEIDSWDEVSGGLGSISFNAYPKQFDEFHERLNKR